MMKIAGPIVHDSFPNVKLFGPEHMLFGVGKEWDWNNLDPSKAVLNDAAANAQLGIWACHGYGADGRTPTATSEEAQFWMGARSRVGPFNKPMWMTETSGYGNDLGAVLDYTQSIHAALYYGRVNGWVHWYGAGDLVSTTALTKKGYAAKHYYRYVRPGARAVSVTVQNDADLFVTAFKHAADRTLTIVLINSASSSKPITFTGSALPAQFRVYQTGATDNCADKGEIASSAITLPASSITTLYYQPLSQAQPRQGNHGTARQPRSERVQLLHHLDGRRADASGPLAAGVYAGRHSGQAGAMTMFLNNQSPR